MNNGGWTNRSTEWQTRGVRSVGRLELGLRDDIVGQKQQSTEKI